MNSVVWVRYRHDLLRVDRYVVVMHIGHELFHEWDLGMTNFMWIGLWSSPTTTHTSMVWSRNIINTSVY